MTIQALYRDDQGLCRPCEVYMVQGEYVTRHGQRLTPTGETTTLKGWGTLDGPAEEYTVGGRGRFLLAEQA